MTGTTMDTPSILTDNLVSAAEEVFEMMIGQTIEPHPEQPRALPEAWGTRVAASVSFAGHRSGLVCIHTSLPAANSIAGAMLGMDAESVNGEMPDAMGEVANLVAGSFRTKMAQHEPASAIAIPTVTVGSDFSTRVPSDAVRVYFPFRMGTESIYLELLLMER
ncbi:MAG: chemotaxis protein CheX [Vicinamibacterales bacterium]